jgi:type I restriction-modification system DNA methylase subunit
MNSDTRKVLRNVVTQCRRLLEEETKKLLQGRFGVHGSGKVEPPENMAHLAEEDQQARREIVEHLNHIRAQRGKPAEALEQLVREISFTHLNRLCAYKLMEAREIYLDGQKFRETVSRGIDSNGFKFYLADHSEDERLYQTGHQETAYRHFLDWVGGLLSEEIGVLFNPNDSANRLYPSQRVLTDVIQLLGDEKLSEIWSEKEDETIGWVYQYFTPKEMRDKARSESRSPRDSNELAFRNQFYTPRYVVQFLTDNTLGRIWYEMRKGDTKLTEQCRYMVRRPNEVFLDEGQGSPETTASNEDLSQEELLKKPVYIPYRPKKDPRELKILDPACGSGHFLLYCFDLLLTIYKEAYADPDLGPTLQEEYATLDALMQDVPRLILAHNLHGIDIDLRATQIAALALWLRCQKAYHEMGLKKNRPKITRSNIVCAEPMPGESKMLREFVDQVDPKILGQLVEVVFDKMRLAGEAGSLLKIEDEIRGAVSEAKRQYEMGGLPLQQSLFDKPVAPGKKRYRVQDLPNDEFFERAEANLVQALEAYAKSTSNGDRFQRRLFAEDAAQGFSFIELCHRRFDVILMNPPFGDISKSSKKYIEAIYENSHSDILAAFVERTLELSVPNGLIGAITNRNCFYLMTMTDYRQKVLQRRVGFEALMDLGEGVLDAMVEAAVYVLRRVPQPEKVAPFIRLLVDEDKESLSLSEVAAVNSGSLTSRAFYSAPADFARLPSSPFCYWVPAQIIKRLSELPPIEQDMAKINVGLQTGYDWRFLRTTWEVSPRLLSPCPVPLDQKPKSIREQCLKELKDQQVWGFFSKTDVASPWYTPITLLVKWENDGFELKNFTNDKGKVRSRPQNESFYFRPGYSYNYRTTRLVPYIVPAGIIPTAGRAQVYPEPGYEMDVLGVCAARLGSAVARFSGQMFSRPLFQASMVQSLPAVELGRDTKELLVRESNSRLRAKMETLSHFEPWHEFVIPALVASLETDDSWQLDTLIGRELEERVAGDAGLSKEDLSSLCRDLDDAIAIRQKSSSSDDGDESEENDDGSDEEDNSISLVDVSPQSQYEGLISYCVGVVLGRWDVRFALDKSLIPQSQDVLDPLPVVPPGTLVSEDGYPAQTGRIVSEAWLKARPNAVYLPTTGSVKDATIPDDHYPVQIDWDGILVDDPEHPDDIVRRVQVVLEVIYKSRAESVEKEACKALGVKKLLGYFCKPGKGGLWDDHVKRYSKSRRKAPIYWLLQSSKKNYAIWLYYHRLDKDMLFKALLNYVEPKIQREENRLGELRSQKSSGGESGKGAKKLDRDIEKQEDLIAELRDFDEKLRKVADLHLVPDLNDGVVLNIAPLHELVPWKEAKKYWKELLDGKYEWSSIGKQLREKGLVAEQ